MIDAGALGVLPIFATILAKRKNIDDLLKFNALPEIREALLDPIFRESYPDSSYLEEFLFSVPPESLSDWERQILVKWLNMHQSYAYADILSSLDVDNKFTPPEVRNLF